MAKPYSVDLCRRALEYIEETADKVKASQLFKLGIAAIYLWIARKKQRGNVEPSPKKGYKKKIDDHKRIAYVEKNEDHFLSECEIVFLPPYSQDLNPIEKYWANMKNKIRELLPTVATLSEAFDVAILSMSI